MHRSASQDALRAFYAHTDKDLKGQLEVDAQRLEALLSVQEPADRFQAQAHSVSNLLARDEERLFSRLLGTLLLS